ncbi:hypothetical protein GIB67_001651 [Kingdonia uniflora]|uniref:Protein kinase domain-containing protein n=1 Tax=Kingdonia uniflora TaxID=39325 RepID=A0A7J7L101_9MAGN|nr:hypothetical protein GIB67_001651 [Kingdonia uniflora]
MSSFFPLPILVCYSIILAPFPLLTISSTPLFFPNKCNDRCGNLLIPFPFHLNHSCQYFHPDDFRLSCTNTSTLLLNIGSQTFQVLEFYSDGILLTSLVVGNSSVCDLHYLDHAKALSFQINGNGVYAISMDNVVGLYDCEDSSVCKLDCDNTTLPACDDNATTSTTTTCCYPLSDHSIWPGGDGSFSVFTQYGCRGFSTWIVPPTSPRKGKRGIKLEWALPADYAKGGELCDKNAFIINATTVKAGVRCACNNGFIGDGFVQGVRCLKSCIKDGREAYGATCNTSRNSKKKLAFLACFFASVMILAILAAIYALLRRSINKSNTSDHHTDLHWGTVSFGKACRMRLFTYLELEEATKGFEDGQKLVDCINGTIHIGVLGDGSRVAVQRVHCENERNLTMILSRVKNLSQVSHKNVVPLLGCCIESVYTVLVIYEYYANGTLEEHLSQGRKQKVGLDWYHRLNIASQTANALAFLQYEISPPIYHHDLKSSSIFLDQDYSVKVAAFKLLSSGLEDERHMCHSSEDLGLYRSDVYDFGVLLLEIISGSRHADLERTALPKIRSGQLEEIVDPLLYFHEQPTFHREQIEIVADLATRCLLFGGDGRMGMTDAARELVHITKESLDRGSRREPVLDETFSNSSLLQMISTSPDSIYVL